MRLFLNIGKALGSSDEWIEPVVDDKSGDVALNYTYDNLINPSEYVSEYTFTIKLKRIAENERLFENITRLDSISSGFNPSIRYEYVIISDFTDIISRGSCFVDIVNENEVKLSMLGSLNYVFNKLINSGWDSIKASEDSDYTLLPDYMKFNGASYTYPMQLTRRLVWTSWMIDSPVYDLNWLKSNVGSLPSYYGLSSSPTDWRTCWCASLIGFAPTNCGYYGSFSPDKWYITGPKNEHLLLPVLAEDENTDYNMELTDRQVCEYRSYYQKPYVYTNKLFQIFKENFPTITEGWTLELDDRWFSDGNPMYAKSIYVLPNLFNEEDSEYTVTGSNYGSGTFSLILPERPSDVWDFVESHDKYGWVDNIGGDEFTFHTDSFQIRAGQTAGTIIEMRPKVQNMNMPWTACFGGDSQGWSEFTNNTQVLFWNPNAQFIKVQVQAFNNNLAVGSKKTYVVVPIPDLMYNGEYVFELASGRQEELAEIGEVIIYRYHATSSQNGDYPIGEFQFPCYYTNTNTGAGTMNIHFGVTMSLYQEDVVDHGHTYPGWTTPFLVLATFAVPTPMYAYPSSGTPYLTFNFDTKYGVIETQRSGSDVTMERLFNGTNPFSVLLKFTKMNNLIWVTDDYNKKVKVIHRYDYFYDCMTTDMGSGIDSYMGLMDITPYMHSGKGFEFTQPSWDTNLVTFNFGEGEEDYADGYEDKYNRTFGSKVIVTGNRKNNDNKDLFNNSDYDKILPPVCSTQIIQPVRNIKTNTIIKKESEAFISNVSDDNNADVTDRFFVRIENREWLDDINMAWRDGFVYISDDITDEYDNNEFAYHGGNFASLAGYKCYECPQIMMSVGNRGVIFGMPREVYAGIGSEQRVQTLYEAFWQKYIENVYASDNKRLTFYVRMSSSMYRRLKMNPLVQFENCAYIVAKIDGWNEKNEITKVTLVQIGDINELTNGQLEEDMDGRFWLWDDGDGMDFDDDSKAIM